MKQSQTILLRGLLPSQGHRQCSAAGTPSLLHTVTAPVTGPASARSRVVVSMGSVPAAGSEVTPPPRRLADHQQGQGAARRRHPAVGTQLLRHPLGTDGGPLELNVVSPRTQGTLADLHQQVGQNLGQAPNVDLAPPARDDLDPFPGKPHHQPVHAVVVALLVLPVPAVQVGPVAAADHRGQHPAHVGRPPHPQFRQVVPPVEHRHQAGLDEPPQVSGDFAGGAAHDLPEPGGPHGGELADGQEQAVGGPAVDGLHVGIVSQPQPDVLRPAHDGMARGVRSLRVLWASSLAQASTATTIWAEGPTSWSGSS